MDDLTLARYRLAALRKWFDTVPTRPVASLTAALVTRHARKRLDTLARV